MPWTGSDVVDAERRKGATMDVIAVPMSLAEETELKGDAVERRRNRAGSVEKGHWKVR
jgi:hypothetical protein